MFVLLPINVETIIKSNILMVTVCVVAGMAIEAKWHPVKRSVSWFRGKSSSSSSSHSSSEGAKP